MTKRPNSMRNLNAAIRRACSQSPRRYVEMRTLMANAIVASMLPEGVVKGGSAIKMRLGDAKTRFTTDLDTATSLEAKEYARRLGTLLEQGWEGFTGFVVPREPAHPKDVPDEYVMQPFDVKLSYLGKPWCTVALEIGFNEVGDADVAEPAQSRDVAAAFEAVGLPSPAPAPLMPLPHQIAQKLHAVTGSDRPRDLVDLQLIIAHQNVDFAQTKRICVRLFAYRQQQSWPPSLAKREGWDEAYAVEAEGLDVLSSADEAVEWVRCLITRIDKAE